MKVAMKVSTQVHVPLRTYCNDVGDHLTFCLAPSSGQNFSLSKCQHTNTLNYCKMMKTVNITTFILLLLLLPFDPLSLVSFLF